MKVILQKSVERLGDPGDVADVADGYARNFLIPRGLAVRAEKGAIRHAESLTRAHQARTKAQKGEFEALAARIIQTPVVVTARAGEEGKLFGSITAADIVGGALGAGGRVRGSPRRPPRRADPIGRDARGHGPPARRGRPGHHGRRPGAGVAAKRTRGARSPDPGGVRAPRPASFVTLVVHNHPHGSPQVERPAQAGSDKESPDLTSPGAIHTGSPLFPRRDRA